MFNRISPEVSRLSLILRVFFHINSKIQVNFAFVEHQIRNLLFPFNGVNVVRFARFI